MTITAESATVTVTDIPGLDPTPPSHRSANAAPAASR